MVAFHLIALKLKGTETPPALPPQLRAVLGRPVGYVTPTSQAPLKPAPPVAAMHPGPGRPMPPAAAGPGRPPIPMAPQPMAPRPMVGVVPPGEWAVPLQAQKKYREQFGMVDNTGTGFINGVQARGILMQSGLPQVRNDRKT